MRDTLGCARRNTIFAFWHGNLFASHLLRKLTAKTSPMYGLISPSRDGAWLSAVFDALNVHAIRGSSGRNGLSAIAETVQKLREGALIAITPDGPRGPMHRVKSGFAMIAQRAQADVIIIALKYFRCIALSSWDRFKIPLPFSKVHADCKMLRCDCFEHMSAEEMTEMLNAEMNDLQKSMDARSDF